MTKKPYGTSGKAKELFDAMRNHADDVRGLSCTQLRDILGIKPKHLSCVLAEAIQRGLLGVVRCHPYSRYYVSQAMADLHQSEAEAEMAVDKRSRRVRGNALADQIRGAFVSDDEGLLINDLLARLPGDQIYMSRMIARLLKSGGLHKYGPPMRNRYSREPFSSEHRAAIDKAEAALAQMRKEKKAAYQRARLVENRPECAKPPRKTAVSRATRLKAGTKSAIDLGLQPPRSKPVTLPFKGAQIVIPDGVVKVERAAPPDMRYYVDPSHRGEFSQQWQQLRAAA